MSQQKIILALCFVACFVATVSGQWSFDPNNCSKSLQENFRGFRSQFTDNVNKCVEELRSHGQNVVDQDTISKETTQMMSSFSSLMSADNLDSNRWMSAMQGAASSYMRLLGAFARPSSGLGMYQTNIRCAASSASIYSSFIMTLPSGCVGGGKY